MKKLIVSFEGVSASGKTTLASTLAAELRTAGFEVHTIHDDFRPPFTEYADFYYLWTTVLASKQIESVEADVVFVDRYVHSLLALAAPPTDRVSTLLYGMLHRFVTEAVVLPHYTILVRVTSDLAKYDEYRAMRGLPPADRNAVLAEEQRYVEVIQNLRRPWIAVPCGVGADRIERLRRLLVGQYLHLSD